MLWNVFLEVFKVILQWLGPAGVDTTLIATPLLLYHLGG